MCLPLEQARDIALPQPINQGVTADRRGLRVREITFADPRDGEGHAYLTSAMTLAPRWLALLYKTRRCLTKPRPSCRRKNPGRPRPRPRRCKRILRPSSTSCGCCCTMGTSNKASKTPPKSIAVKTAGPAEKRPEENRASPSADLYTAATLQAAFKLIRWLRTHGINPPRCRKPCSSYAPAMLNFNPANPTPMSFISF